MAKKLTYEELEQRVKELEKKVAKRKRAEEELRESEEKLRVMFESIEDGISIVDLAGQVLETNKAHLRMFGYRKEELIGQNALDSIAEKDLAKAMDNLSRITDEEHIALTEYMLRDKDGREFCGELSATLLRDSSGNPAGIISVMRDISERKRAEKALQGAHAELEQWVEERAVELVVANEQLKREIEEHKQAQEALRESEEKFRVLIEKSPLGVSIIAEDAHYKYLNPKFIDIFGYTLKDIPTGQVWFRKAHPDPEYRKQLISTWFSDLEESKVGELRPRTANVTCKEGSEKVIQFRAVTMETGDQFVIYEDITEQRKLQAQLQRAQTMETVGTLAGGVAHDLNNILAGLVSYPELLLLETPKDSPLRKPMLTIQKSGEKAAAIVQDLLTLARRGVAVTEVLNLNHIISEYVKSPEHEKLISFHPNVQVKTNLEKDLLNILGSPTHLSKTVMNLVSNAAEAMPDGGEISISTESLYIDQPIRGYDYVEEGDYVTLTISDTGLGISKKDRERIFEPFYTKKAMGRSGTGLGMAVVWGTVKDHKGYIDIQSAKGKGATFTLYLPVTRKELAKDKSLLTIEDYMGKGESILVVDDVEEQREIASRILKKLGYSVASVSSGEEAVDYLKDNSADLLLLDMIMDPGIDGLETYKRILEFHPKQKAIIVSGFSETKRVKEAQRLGAGAYVKKPFLLQRIGLAVRDELGR